MVKAKILVVEDDFITRQGYVTALFAEGFSVLEVQDGLEGLKVINRERPDLILSDIMMPLMDGIDMLKKMREGTDYEKNVPVVLLTNLSAGVAKVEEKVLETGPVYYILKSDFTFRQVVERVKEILVKK
jgi:DNA-binding response OmpR family regulator